MKKRPRVEVTAEPLTDAQADAFLDAVAPLWAQQIVAERVSEEMPGAATPGGLTKQSDERRAV